MKSKEKENRKKEIKNNNTKKKNTNNKNTKKDVKKDTRKNIRKDVKKDNKKDTRMNNSGKREHVQIIPLGGLDKIGMNITAIRYGNEIIVVDCGLSFPDEDLLGIDKVIPDVTYLIENKNLVKGFFITHGHEDHIGALPYILPQINVPVYGTKLTMGLISHKLEETGFLDRCTLNTVKQGATVRLSKFSVEFIKTNHSIPGACSLAIRTPAGLIFHTGDFKVDYTPLFGDAIDLQRIAAIGKEGVLAVLSDSTNALREGFTPSETNVARTIDTLFAEHTKNRILVATFSSNVDRVQQVMNTAKKYNRKVVLSGRSMETTIEIAAELGLIKIPKGIMIEDSEMKNYPDNKLVLITTGSQGESMAALSKMASGEHKKVSIKPGDVIVFSSNPIPGNERAVSKVMNELSERGARIIYQDTHVSGHACQQELQLIYTLLKPKYAVPMHGEYRHLAKAAELVKGLGMPAENVFLLRAGDVLDMSFDKAEVVDKAVCGEIYVDGLGVGDVGNVVIRDRQLLADSGIVMVALTIEKESGDFVAGPEIITRGFIYVKESKEIIDEIHAIVINSLLHCQEKRIKDINRMRSVIKQDVEDYLWRKFQRSPIVLPVILETI